jgi:hypothetical protein
VSTSDDRDRGSPSRDAWTWASPFPLGQANAADAADSVASALFAGFSLTLLTLVVQDPGKFRWPGVGLALLALAAVLFVASVQCAFWAKQYAINPDDLDRWYGGMSHRNKVAFQRGHQLNFLRWAGRGNTSYRIGILCLLGGMAVALVPSGAVDSERIAAIAIICVGLVVELLWIFSTWLLAGSSSITFGDRPDLPSTDVRFARLRCSPTLRRLARGFVPLARVRVPPSDPA